jgi:hypothetical protein
MTIRLRGLLSRLALLVGAPLIALALLEGAASLLLFTNDLANSGDRPMAEAKHTRYDAELGWVSVPHATVIDHYGPGRSLHTNARGFRGRNETPDRPPPGKRRVICSGDSFTLGWGVDDGEAWCALLAALDTTLETVNMGQGGYGIDQAYLWYRRDGANLVQDLQIFAVITDDFRRIRESRFLGYGKPVLRAHGDSLEVLNVPVPGRSPWTRLATGSVVALRKLRLFDATQRLQRRMGGRAALADSAARDSAAISTVAAVVRDLQRRHRALGSQLVLVYLPWVLDYAGRSSNTWRARLGAIAEREGVLYVDLVVAFRRMPPDSVSAHFIPFGAPGWAGAGGHYTALGNRWVAGQLLPIVQSALRAAGTGAGVHAR